MKIFRGRKNHSQWMPGVELRVRKDRQSCQLVIQGQQFFQQLDGLAVSSGGGNDVPVLVLPPSSGKFRLSFQTASHDPGTCRSIHTCQSSEPPAIAGPRVPYSSSVNKDAAGPQFCLSVHLVEAADTGESRLVAELPIG